ncbi:MAG: hypothetical protein ACXW0Z_07455 [Gemmatirosa sp.]
MHRFLSALADIAPGVADVVGVVWPWVKWGSLSCTLALGLFVEIGRRRQWDGRLGSAHEWASAFIDDFEADGRRSLRTMALLLASVLIVSVALWAFGE